VFGSLAQRSEINRRQLAALFETCPRALKVFDVNLRPPYDDQQRVWTLARQSDFIKLNDHELWVLLKQPKPGANLEAGVRQFAEQAGVSRVCLTAGASGAGLLLDGAWYWEDAQPTPVRDSVGAGDAFLAALLLGWLRRVAAPPEILRRACRLAEFIVTQDGATPVYPVKGTGEAELFL